MYLEMIWYFVIILSLICYAMLDGFDLGVGLLHLPLAKNDNERRIFLNAIGPVWDGNEVWLVVVGGALFAGFTEVYATLFSAFYIPVMLLLMGLIFRAVSIEFRSKRDSLTWRQSWDSIFALGSLIISFGIGVVLGNLILGFPLDENHNYLGTFVNFLHPYALLVGVLTVSLFAMHGAIFLVMKTEGPLHDRLRKNVPYCIGVFIAMYVATTITTLFIRPYMGAPIREYPVLSLIPLFSIVAILAVPYLMKKQRDGWAFLSSCLSIAFLLILAALGTYPYMIRSSIATQENSLFIFNSASSPLTLKILIFIVIIGVPLVLSYGFYIYRIFRGKVKLDETSY